MPVWLSMLVHVYEYKCLCVCVTDAETRSGCQHHCTFSGNPFTSILVTPHTAHTAPHTKANKTQRVQSLAGSSSLDEGGGFSGAHQCNTLDSKIATQPSSTSDTFAHKEDHYKCIFIHFRGVFSSQFFAHRNRLSSPTKYGGYIRCCWFLVLFICFVLLLMLLFLPFLRQCIAGKTAAETGGLKAFCSMCCLCYRYRCSFSCNCNGMSCVAMALFHFTICRACN